MIQPKQIIRTNRKTLALVINKSAELIVRAPYGISNAAISRFVAAKQLWILQKQEQVRNRKSVKIAEKSYINGENLLYLGNSFIIEYANVSFIQISKNKLLVPQELEGSARESITQWLKSEARVCIKSHLDYYADNLGEKYSKFALSNARTRWGSCGAHQSINLNWRLILCPEASIDAGSYSRANSFKTPKPRCRVLAQGICDYARL